MPNKVITMVYDCYYHYQVKESKGLSLSPRKVRLTMLKWVDRKRGSQEARQPSG